MDRDRRLAEMMGMIRWHCPWCNKFLEPAEVTYEEDCAHCGFHLSDPDFSTPEWRARLMDWAVEQEWGGDFLWSRWSAWAPTVKNVTRGDFVAYLWRNLATLIVEYHGEGR